MNNIFNIKKLIALTILVFIFNKQAYSQNESTTLVFKEKRNELNTRYNLILTSTLSHWKELTTPNVDENRIQDVDYISTENYTKREVYKDLNNEFVYSNYNILNHNFYVKDKIEPLKWTLLDSTETILNYNCQIAKTKFRGRTYLASFTKEIASSNGPWKFQGLPGLILKVISINDLYEKFEIECVEISTNSNNNIEETFKKFINKYDKKFITWRDFVLEIDTFLKKHIQNIKSSGESSDSGSYAIKFELKHYKEIFHKEVQTKGIIIEM